jgi:hypothetical protein
MQGSLDDRYFVDATTRWICPDQRATAERLIKDDGVTDVRAICALAQSDTRCLYPVGVDPMK